jgi:NTP pyrophosphatase (non-canonical NTP hydrolase)
MQFNEYQDKATKFACYGDKLKVVYPTIGLTGEAGEVAEKVKKVLRDSNGVFTKEHVQAIEKELGDVLWYVQQMCSDLGLKMGDVANKNIEKLSDRKERDKLQGSGDDR